jgi:tetratricopeptide (TPR) repeat protein
MFSGEPGLRRRVSLTMGTGPAGRAGGRHDEESTPTCGQLLQRYRSLAGLTQEVLAERAGYSADYIGKLERDQRELPAAALERLGTVLGLTEHEHAALRAARDRGPPAHSLVGRDAELAEIRHHLAGLGPPVLLFAAEPGMGKTRLLEEAAALAARSGWGAARGACQRRAQDLYAPLSGALTDALRHLPDRDRAEALRQSGQLELLLPELAPAAEGPGSGDESGNQARTGNQPEQQRRRLFSSAEGCLRAAAGQAGTLLILDDLHWAGPDALDLLTALVTAGGSPPIRLIGAYRDSETSPRLDEFTADLARTQQVRRRELEPLSDAEAERLLVQLTTGRPDMPTMLPAIIRRAGGVPFFLVSYAEDVRDSSQNTKSVRVPWTVASVIRQRVLALPIPAQELLGVAAVIGPTVPHRLLTQVAGSSDEELLQAAEAALDARLLTEDGQASYCFTHDLIRETIEHGLSAGRRRLLHRRIGESLEREPGAPTDSLARHFGLSDDDGKATAYLVLAGEQAQQRVAYAAAADFFARAASRLELAGRPSDAIPITEKHGVALHRAGRHGEAITALERALAGYQAAGDEEGAHRVTGHLAVAHFRKGTSPDSLGQLAGLAAVGQAQDIGSRGALTRWQGLFRLLYAQGSYQQMVTEGRSLAEAGRASGNSKLEAIGAGVEGAGLICLGRLSEGTALLEAAMPPAPAANRRIADAAVMLSGAYLARGLVDRSHELSTRMLRTAESVDDQVLVGLHTLMLGAACYVRGDWPRGQDLIDRAQQHFTAGEGSPLTIRVVPVLGMTMIWRGVWDQARSYLETALQAAQSTFIANAERAALVHLAELDVLQGHPQQAVTRLLPFMAKDLAWDYGVTSRTTLAAAYLDLGDLPSARTYAERAVAESRRIGAGLQEIWALRMHGMIETRHGNHELALAAYQDGLQRARAMPCPYGEAQLLHAHGLLDRQQGNQAAAQAKFSAALAIAETLGATKEAGRLREALAETG